MSEGLVTYGSLIRAFVDPIGVEKMTLLVENGLTNGVRDVPSVCPGRHMLGGVGSTPSMSRRVLTLLWTGVFRDLEAPDCTCYLRDSFSRVSCAISASHWVDWAAKASVF